MSKLLVGDVRQSISKGMVLIALLIIGVIATSRTSYAREVALVIGNSDYPQASIRSVSVDTSRLVGKLRSSGVEVVSSLDGRRFEVKQAIEDFGKLADGADFAFVYLAGHSLRLGRSYFVPAGITLRRRNDRPHLAPLQSIYTAAGNASAGLVLLDLCYQQDFAAGWGDREGRAPVCSAEDLKFVPPENTVSYLSRRQSVPPSQGDSGLASFWEDAIRPGADMSDLLKSAQREFGRRSQPLLIGQPSEVRYSLTGTADLMTQTGEIAGLEQREDYADFLSERILSNYRTPAGDPGPVSCVLSASQDFADNIRIAVDSCGANNPAVQRALQVAISRSLPLSTPQGLGLSFELLDETMIFEVLIEQSKPEPNQVPLFVEAEPSYATIRILNIGPIYQAGMLLDEGGAYHLEVSAPGFDTQYRWITLTPDNSSPRFDLAPELQVSSIGSTDSIRVAAPSADPIEQLPAIDSAPLTIALEEPSAPVADNPETIEPAALPTPISGDDRRVVYDKFQALIGWLGTGNLSSVLREVDNSESRQLIVQLLQTYDSIDAVVPNLVAQDALNKISGTLTLTSLKRSNGDVAAPGNSFSRFEVFSQRSDDGTWGKLILSRI